MEDVGKLKNWMSNMSHVKYEINPQLFSQNLQDVKSHKEVIEVISYPG